MENQYEKKITWTIKNFSSLQAKNIYSDQFVAGHCKWRLLAYPKRDASSYNCLSLFLNVADSKTLLCGWRRHTKYRLTVVNQLSNELSKVLEYQEWFDQESPTLGRPEMFPLSKLVEKNGGFLVNGEVKIVAEVDVIEVIAKSDVLEETSSVKEIMDVNGFQVTSSHVETVNSLFKKHPDIASSFRPKNTHLRTSYMNVLLSLNEILCQPSEELSRSDLAHAYSALRFLTKAGFKLDWLEKKLKEAAKFRIHEIQVESKDLKQKSTDMKQKSTDMDALLEFLV